MQITATQVKEVRERTGAGMMECKRALVDAKGDIDTAIQAMRKAGLAKADKKAGRIAAEGMVAVRVSTDTRSGAMVEVNCETDFVAKEQQFRDFVEALVDCVLRQRPGDVEALLALPFDADSQTTVEVRRRELVAKIGENISVRRMCVIECDGGRVAAYSHGGRIGVLVATDDASEEVARDVAMHVAASRPLCIRSEDVPSDVLDKEKEIFMAQAADSGKPPEIVEKMVAGRLNKYLKEITLLGQPFVKDPDQSVEKFLAQSSATVSRFERFEVGEGIERKSENFADEVMAQLRDSE